MKVRKVSILWEIWKDEQYLGTTDSLQIVEIAVERGFKVIQIQ